MNAQPGSLMRSTLAVGPFSKIGRPTPTGSGERRFGGMKRDLLATGPIHQHGLDSPARGG
jgi:hypothetical protein